MGARLSHLSPIVSHLSPIEEPARGQRRFPHRNEGAGDETFRGSSREDNEIQGDLRPSLTAGPQRTKLFPAYPRVRPDTAHTMRVG